MRVAILHDHLSFLGGGERLIVHLAAALDADLYVTDYDPELTRKLGRPDLRVTELAKVPRRPILRQTAQARAFLRARVPAYDAYVVSGNWAVFGAERHRPNLWYCHTPVRVFYDLREPFLGGLSLGKRLAAEGWIRRWTPRYERAVQGVDRIVANSRNVADRIQKYLGRTAGIVYPPVDTVRYRFRRIGDFWLSVNRLSHEKRIRLQVEAFRRLPEERLVVVGGPQMGVDAKQFIRNLDAPRNVELVGEVEESELLNLYADCRGFVATSADEDFGLAPVEAMAAGKFVLAVDEGGYRESVVSGETGWLVPPTPEALAAAVSRASREDLAARRGSCEARARLFDVSVFEKKMRALVEGMVAQRATDGPATF